MRLPILGRGPRPASVAPLTVLTLAVFMGMVALVIDGGQLLEERRHAQATADAAALAAAADLYANYVRNTGTDPNGTAQASALTTAAANGCTNDGVHSTVTVRISPENYLAGSNAGQMLPAGYVEVIVQINRGRTFSNLFGSGSVPVRARAVARGQLGGLGANVLLLNLHAPGALSVTGSANVVVASSSLRVNSDSASAISLTGSGSLSAPQFNLVGNYSKTGSGKLTGPEGAAPTINIVQAIPDPLRYLPAPDPVALGLATRNNGLDIRSGAVDLYPGVYPGGIQVTGSASVTLHPNADGTPGIYYLEGGGLSVTGSASIQTAGNETGGVMIYNDWTTGRDAISLTGSGSLTIQPPASGPYQGISIFQRRGTPSAAAPTIALTGTGNMNLYGTLYAAYGRLSVTGSGDAGVMGGQYVLDSLTVTGNGTVRVDPGIYPVARARLLGLVE